MLARTLQHLSGPGVEVEVLPAHDLARHVGATYRSMEPGSQLIGSQEALGRGVCTVGEQNLRPPPGLVEPRENRRGSANIRLLGRNHPVVGEQFGAIILVRTAVVAGLGLVDLDARSSAGIPLAIPFAIISIWVLRGRLPPLSILPAVIERLVPGEQLGVQLGRPSWPYSPANESSNFSRIGITSPLNPSAHDPRNRAKAE